MSFLEPPDSQAIVESLDQELSPAQKSQRSWNNAVAWLLVYTILVILFGAVVRITGSGAGCGQHWPSCHGEIVHLPRSVENWIEWTHRLTSGLTLLWAAALAWISWRRGSRGSLLRKSAFATLLFLVGESLVGAALVLLSLVGKNDSWLRALVMALHLINTTLLVSSLWVWMVAFAGRRAPLHGLSSPWFWLGGGSLVLTAALGAVTALGDTLYPVEVQSSLSVLGEVGAHEGHFLERLRAVHPVVAILGSGALVYATERVSGLRFGRIEAFRRTIYALLATQLLVGWVSVSLSAPAWLQVVHLAFFNFLWLSFFGLVCESDVSHHA